MKHSDQNLVVIELFTSQGCNLCPPADAVLAELSQQDNVLALSYSVDYWNYLGWKDTLAMPNCTDRQKKYNIFMGKNGVYTPQMIIQGSHDLVGSQGDMAEKMIQQARMNITAQQNSDFDISFVNTGTMIELKVGSRETEWAATIWVIGYDYEKTVTIKNGELGGQTRKYHNVVQAIKRIGSWTGEEVKLTLSKADIGEGVFDAYALILQAQETGPILAAAKLKN